MTDYLLLSSNCGQQLSTVFTYYLSNRKYSENAEANTTIFATTAQNVKTLTGSTKKFWNSLFVLIRKTSISRT